MITPIKAQDQSGRTGHADKPTMTCKGLYAFNIARETEFGNG